MQPESGCEDDRITESDDTAYKFARFCSPSPISILEPFLFFSEEVNLL